jgi:hypothetical protein
MIIYHFQQPNQLNTAGSWHCTYKNRDRAYLFQRGINKCIQKQTKQCNTRRQPVKEIPSIKTPTTPVITANAHPSAAVILPAATGRLAVRFMIASVSFSTTWLIAFALPVTNNPATRATDHFPIILDDPGASK